MNIFLLAFVFFGLFILWAAVGFVAYIGVNGKKIFAWTWKEKMRYESLGLFLFTLAAACGLFFIVVSQFGHFHFLLLSSIGLYVSYIWGGRLFRTEIERYYQR